MSQEAGGLRHLLYGNTPHIFRILFSIDEEALQHGRFRYLYDHTEPGPKHVAAMIALAAQGKGLSTYVTQHVQNAYAARSPLEKA